MRMMSIASGKLSAYQWRDNARFAGGPGRPHRICDTVQRSARHATNRRAGTAARSQRARWIDFDLAKLRGKVVMVNYWATWCAPCRKEMPKLDAFYKKYQPQGLEIVGISIDFERDLEKTRKIARTVAYPMALAKAITDDGFGIPKGVPTTWIIDTEGKVRDRFIEVRDELLNELSSRSCRIRRWSSADERAGSVRCSGCIRDGSGGRDRRATRSGRRMGRRCQIGLPGMEPQSATGGNGDMVRIMRQRPRRRTWDRAMAEGRRNERNRRRRVARRPSDRQRHAVMVNRTV